jgi:hypothetical protein
MPEANETKGKKKGFFALLKESVRKSSEGCGPGCGCHAAAAKKTAKGDEAAKDGTKA